MNFIIWNYLEDPIRVEKSKNLLKTYNHRCEASRREAVAISNPSSLRGFPKGSRVNLPPLSLQASQRAVLHPLSLRARLRRAWQSQTLRHCEAPEGKPCRFPPLSLRAPKGQSYTRCHCEPASGGRGNLKSFVIARLPKGKPWQSLFKSKSKINS